MKDPTMMMTLTDTHKFIAKLKKNMEMALGSL